MKAIRKAEYHFETLSLYILPLRSDNYSYVIHDSKTQQSLVIDPSETKPIVAWLEEHGLGLDWILDTHHHNDHIEGNPGLKERYEAKIAASAYDIGKGRITGEPDHILKDGEQFAFGDYRFRIMATPGHTLGHVCLFLEGAQWLFSGDTLFSLGCGRLFEGDPAMLWESFQKLRNLPDETLVFCGHEYTLANANFIRSLELDLKGFPEHQESLNQRWKDEQKTIPSKLGDEKKFNPYFLADTPSLAKFGASATEVFAKVRSLKDSF